MHLWRVWVVEYGREGIVLKHPGSPYKSGLRSRSWLKRREKLTLQVEVLHCPGEVIEWGDRGMACVLALTYRHPRSDEVVTIEQAVRVPYPADWKPRCGPCQIICWGVLRSGLLRHPVLVAS